MKTVAIEMEDKINELLDCLDRDIEHIQESLLNLDRLRSFVIKRDDDGLGRLLENIQAGADAYKEHEAERQSIRTALANSFGCNVGDVTLSRLELSVTDAKRARIVQSKTKLRSLTERFRKEYSSTAKLLSECARFNNLLLRSILDLGNKGMVCYGAKGTTKTQSDSAFVNVKF